MKKIILCLCIVMITFLGSTYIKAIKPAILYNFYARTFNDTYVKMYGYYEGTNCLNFNGKGYKCGYYVVPIDYPNIYPGDPSGDLPDSLSTSEISNWTQQGYLIPFSTGKGVYLTD